MKHGISYNRVLDSYLKHMGYSASAQMSVGELEMVRDLYWSLEDAKVDSEKFEVDWVETRKQWFEDETPTPHDPVNHPLHYTQFGAEVIDIVEWLPYNRGNAVKYLARAGSKDPSPEGTLQDLKKAQWYVNREIKRLGGLENV